MTTAYNYLGEWMGKALLLLEWTLIRIRPTVEILKELKKTKIREELENSPAQLKSKFK